MLVRLSAGLLIVLVTVAVPQLQTPSAPDHNDGGRDAAGYPTAGSIMNLAVDRASRQDEAGIELGFMSLIQTTVDSLNGDGEVTKTETSLHKRYAIDDVLYEELVERDGQPLTEDEIRNEQKEREKFVREAKERARRGEEVETNDERQVRFDRDLMGRFDATVTGVETIDGESAWVLFFEPKPGKLPETTRIDKALNRSNGRLYVSQRDHGIMRIEFEMREPVRFLWGFVATLKNAVGRLEFERVEPEVWLPRKFDLEIDLRVFFRNRRQQVVREWVERQRLAEATS